MEAEQAQRVASLSKVLLWVPGGRAQGGPVPLLSKARGGRKELIGLKY